MPEAGGNPTWRWGPREGKVLRSVISGEQGLPVRADLVPDDLWVRWVVERTFACLHQFKRLRTRYERRADLHQGLLELDRSLICIRRLRTSS